MSVRSSPIRRKSPTWVVNLWAPDGTAGERGLPILLLFVAGQDRFDHCLCDLTDFNMRFSYAPPWQREREREIEVK